MDIKQIQELVKLLNKSEVSEIKIEEGDFKLTLRSKEFYSPKYASVMQAQPMMQTQALMQTAAPAQTAVAAPAAPVAAAEAKPAAAATSIEFRSPMIGTFYRKPGPDKPIFKNVGDEVKKGDVVCIIEAMKLFNEIEYDGEPGRILKIMVDDANPVEYDQVLFLVEPIK